MKIINENQAMSSSKLLLDEYPLVILPSLAVKVGLNESIILQQVHYWLNNAQKAGDEYKFRHGHWWTYGTYQDWQKDNFQFWSVSTIGRIFRNLEERGILISEQPNVDRYDRTKWYTIDYEVLGRIIDDTNLTSSDVSDCDEQECQDGTVFYTETSAETSSGEGESPPDLPLTVSSDSSVGTESVPTLQQQMVEAISLSTGFDMRLHGARLGKSASKLIKADYQPEFIAANYKDKESWWYKNDWRGQKGEMPTPEQIVETIGRINTPNGKLKTYLEIAQNTPHARSQAAIAEYMRRKGIVPNG